MNQPLPPELRELEQMLSSLVPRALASETAELLTGSVDANLGTQSQSSVDEGLDDLEKHLGQISPATMRTDVLSRMIKAMDSWHEHVPVEEKVISFSDSPATGQEQKTQSGGMLAAAAAVALLGAVTALVIPHVFPEQSGDAAVADSPETPDNNHFSISTQSDAKQAWLVPDALSHRVVNTADRGIVMTGNQTPHRCIRLDSMERIKIEDEDGREFTIDRPSVRYVLIPVETN